MVVSIPMVVYIPMVHLMSMVHSVPMVDPMPIVDSIYKSYILDPNPSSLYHCLCRRSIEPFPLVVKNTLLSTVVMLWHY